MPFTVLLFLAAAAAEPVDLSSPQGSRRQSTAILSEDPGSRRLQEDWGYSDAIAAGKFVFLSGVVASPKPSESDLKLAYERAFATMAGTWDGSAAAGATSSRSHPFTRT